MSKQDVLAMVTCSMNRNQAFHVELKMNEWTERTGHAPLLSCRSKQRLNEIMTM